MQKPTSYTQMSVFFVEIYLKLAFDQGEAMDASEAKSKHSCVSV